MEFDWWTLGLQVVNFLVLVWLLQHFLFRPALARIDGRRAKAARLEAEAEDAKRHVQSLSENLETRLAAAENARRDAVLAAEKELADKRDDMLAEARRDAQAVLDDARRQIEAERASVSAGLRLHAAQVARDLAGTLLAALEEKPPPDAYVTAVLGQLAALAPQDRRRLAGGGGVELATEPAIDGAELDRWRQQLAGLGLADVTYAHRPDLLAGARLTMSGAVIEASWRDSLDTALREIVGDAQSR